LLVTLSHILLKARDYLNNCSTEIDVNIILFHVILLQLL